ncbi:MAG: DUF72 domain-containing protein [Cyanobacteria bacterium P01_A01_bin.37]
MAKFYLGCAVWAFKNWIGDLYPQGSRSTQFLNLYSKRLTAVEGNTTFYSVPSEAMVQRWLMETPDTFRFCLKLPRDITHQGLLMPQFNDAIAFLDRVKPLGDRLGPFFIQLPPGYSPKYADDLEEFLSAWPRESFPIATEVRHIGWFQTPQTDRLNIMLRQLGVGRVLLDTRPIYDCPDDPQVASERKKPQVPLLPVTTTSFSIIRYISHPNEDFNQTYWKEWVEHVGQWLQQGLDIYFFVHCPIEERSPTFAHRIQQLLEQANVPITPLPWDSVVDQQPSQLSLFGP